MKALFKTLFGSPGTVLVGGGALLLALAVLQSPLPVLAGIALPCCLLAGALYLACN